ncbi:MAG: histone deacetylase family protein [Planctomycetota bacterium]|jgi:acetoin utilization deacetylase AcuC-like enzyme
MPALFFDPVFLTHDTGHHPECPARLEAIMEALRASPAFPPEGPRECPAVEPEVLYRVHAPGYVDHIQWMAARGGGALGADTVLSAGSYDAAVYAAGAAVAAVEGVMAGEFPSAFCAVRPPGHHAMGGKGMGFCIFNNVAVAARHAREALGVERVLIIDWDVHHGNGTQAIFDDDPTVFYISLHRHPHYPGTGAPTDDGYGDGKGTMINVQLDGGTGPDEFLQALREALGRAREFSAGLVLISAGFDAAEGDALGGMHLVPETYAEATRMVRELAKAAGHQRIVSVLEGGYHLEALGPCVRAHFEALP